MKLYYAPGASSMAAHIVKYEAGVACECEAVDLKTKKTASGADFFAIHPKGYVPALLLDDGSLLTEGTAIMLYFADQAPDSNLAPQRGNERYQLYSWLNFIATELHKNFSPLFNPKAGEDWKTAAAAMIEKRLQPVAERLARESYLLGSHYSIADAYLFTVLGWSKWVKFDLSRWPVFETYLARIAERPAVRATLAAEKAARG